MDPYTSKEPMRFSLLDAGLFLFGVSVSWMLDAVIPQSEVRSAFGTVGASIERILIIVLRGITASGPLVLISHFLFKGREGNPTLGEWLWVVQAAVFAVFWLIGTFVPMLVLLGLAFLVFTEIGMLVVGSVAVVTRMRQRAYTMLGRPTAIRRSWSDSVGLGISGAVSLTFLLNLRLYPLTI